MNNDGVYFFKGTPLTARDAFATRPLQRRYLNFLNSAYISAILFLVSVSASPSMASSPTHEIEYVKCSKILKDSFQVFRVIVSRLLDGQEIYQLCLDKNSKKNLLLFRHDAPIKKEVRESRKVLDRKLLKKITRLSEKAYEFQLAPSPSTLDGSTWCLEYYQQSTYQYTCFQNPMRNTTDRGINGLVELVNELWAIDEFGMKNENLY